MYKMIAREKDKMLSLQTSSSRTRYTGPTLEQKREAEDRRIQWFRKSIGPVLGALYELGRSEELYLIHDFVMKSVKMPFGSSQWVTYIKRAVDENERMRICALQAKTAKDIPKEWKKCASKGLMEGNANVDPWTQQELDYERMRAILDAIRELNARGDGFYQLREFVNDTIFGGSNRVFGKGAGHWFSNRFPDWKYQPQEFQAMMKKLNVGSAYYFCKYVTLNEEKFESACPGLEQQFEAFQKEQAVVTANTKKPIPPPRPAGKEWKRAAPSRQ